MAKVFKTYEPSDNSTEGDIKWAKPPSGHVKCNIDSSFPTQLDITEHGICFRDDKGVFSLPKQAGAH